MKRNNHKSQLKYLTFKNDPILKMGNVIENNGVKIVNIYKIMLDKKDFTDNKKGEILKRCPYIYNINRDIKPLICLVSGKKNHALLRHLLASYLNTRYVRNDTFSRWIENNLYPLPLIRIICMLSDKDLFKTIEGNVITDFCKQSSVKMPLKLDTLLSPFMAYFIGLHLGDGTLGRENWKITDGHEKVEYLKYSVQFLNKLKNGLKNKYELRVSGPYKIKNKNAYDLVVSNKWFCRFLNSFFGLPFGEKNLRISNMALFVDNDILKSEVIRGLFDSDGSAERYRAMFATSIKKILNYVRSFLYENGIMYSTSILKRKEGNPLYIIRILNAGLDKFGKLIGFLHPKKQEILINALKKPSLERKLLGLKEGTLKEGCFDINRIRIHFNNKCKKIRFPIKPTKEIMYLAKHVRVVKGHRKLRIAGSYENKNTNINKIGKILKSNFGVEIKKVGKEYYAFSRYLELFFDTFFEYDYVRKGITNAQACELRTYLKSKWN